jgi:hypothetical protein
MARTVRSFLLFTLLFATTANAFDTGHHHDLTASAMRTFGFKARSIKVAQLENWLVDYYSSQPLAGLETDLKKLHFDNLEDSARVRIYWQRLKVNSKAAFEKAAADGDSMRVVALLGMSLHAVQDFYAHSDWVEQHSIPSSGYQTDTYFDHAALAAGALRTGHYPNHLPLQGTDHGDGQSGTAGMNHDAYTRPRWDRAYVFAFCASRQWIEAARSWVTSQPGGDQVWTKALDLALSAGKESLLDRDLRAAYRISEYAPGGHWKGPGSESKLEFVAAVGAFARSSDSPYAKHFKEKAWHRQLTDELDLDSPPATDPTIPAMTHPYVAVSVRTLLVSELPVGVLERKIDPGGKADFFAKLSIDGHPFVESMQLDASSPQTAWTAIAFIPKDQADLAIVYEVWDEDGAASSEDDLCDILEGAGKSSLDFRFRVRDEMLSGDLQGVHNSEANAAESSGELPDQDRAKVKLIISKAALLSP